MKINTVYNEVLKHDGIKCSTICERLDINQNVSSGILSLLKRRGLIHNDKGHWYITRETPIVKTVKLDLIDINSDDFDVAWCEGYITGLVHHNIIDEREFDLLLNWLNQINE